MIRIIQFTLISIISFFTCLSGKIVETKNFCEIEQYLSDNTILILDIDDTLLIPVQMLGNDAWFCYRLQGYLSAGLAKPLALDKALAEWEAIRHLTKVKIVEEGTQSIIDKLQVKKVTIMGLTTQGLALATRTIHQLNTLGIDLSKTSPSQQDHYFMNQEGVLFREGILFTSGSPKGPALLKFFDIIGFSPKRIVFINDKATHLQDVEASAEQKGIDFIGLRYSFSDQRIANFRKEIADIQWNNSTFSHLLSDQEAEDLLKPMAN